MIVGDSWFVFAPALLLALAPAATGSVAQALLVAVAILAQSLADFAVSSLRLWAAIGVDPRDDLRAYAWTYLVDFLLAPIGLLAAWAADELPASPAALLSLAGLLALFAHERRGRMANAIALQVMTEESRDRLQSIVQHASDLILILDADGRLRTVTGSTAAFGGTRRLAAGPGAPRRRGRRGGLPGRGRRKAAPASRPRRSGGCSTPTAPTGTCPRWRRT